MNIQDIFRISVSTLLLFIILFFKTTSEARNLQAADSLFESKKFVLAYPIYDSLFHEAGFQSPQMLLKMAMINEGLGDPAKAIYFLSIFQRQTQDPQAEIKIREMASDYGISGYEYNDYKYLRNLVYRNANTINLIFSLVVLSLMGWSIFNLSLKKTAGPESYVALASAIIFVFFLWWSVPPKTAIVFSKNGFLMKGPSAGSGQLSSLDYGSKVRIIRKKKAWFLVQASGSEGYIRDNSVKILP